MHMNSEPAALIAFELSGEHPRIPSAEVIGALEAENIDFSIYHDFDQVLVVKISRKHIPQMNLISRRLAMTWHIMEVLGITDAVLPDILAMAENVKYNNSRYLSYCVRAKKIKRKISISSEEIERGIGRVLYYKGFRADLKNPDIQYRIVLTDGKCIFGQMLKSIDRSDFETRNPQNKPYFYPGVLMPRLARALVNIARLKRDETMLDPYCGTGGLMVEAGLVGAHTIGCDVQKKILLGATMNLDFYSANYSVLLQDAVNMALRDRCVDSVVTDPPYGRSARVQAQSLENLMRNSLCEIFRVLRPGGRAVVVSEYPIEDWAEDAGLAVIEVFTERVHKSLTRRITVLDKCL